MYYLDTPGGNLECCHSYLVITVPCYICSVPYFFTPKTDKISVKHLTLPLRNNWKSTIGIHIIRTNSGIYELSWHIRELFMVLWNIVFAILIPIFKFLQSEHTLLVVQGHQLTDTSQLLWVNPMCGLNEEWLRTFEIGTEVPYARCIIYLD